MLKELMTEEDSGDDLRNELMSAMKTVEETGDAEKQSPTDTSKEGAGEEVAKDPESPKAGDPESGESDGEEEKKPEPLLKEDKAPQSWSPAAREKWNQIPDDLRKEIIRREEAAAVGVRQLNERFAPAVKFVESLGPILQEARNAGIEPTGYISSVMQTEHALRTADTKGKFNVLLSLADQYGVPLREIINASVGQEVLQKGAQPGQQQMALPPELVQELEENRRWRREQEGSRVQSEIVSFSNGKEFFEDVRGQMADLLQSGVAEDLNDAYDKACWADPNIRKVLIERERQGQQRTDISQRQQAAGLVNIPSQGAINVKTGNEEESLEDSIRAAFRTSSTGRI